MVVGSVAVNAHGARVGKGGGYSDLEFALARQLGAVTRTTPVLTTVHGLQLVKTAIPMTDHDVPVDLIVTPERVIRTAPIFDRPGGDAAAGAAQALKIAAAASPSMRTPRTS